ncbi:toxin-antitoxin system YwqK family antitoxin [Aquimarina algicola]|uniref:Toxin-antitoxin system YwqK family antitoxin n=1 Tax=Aquimarina algicola TaxID=2589995 RepID=A0A504IY53_9FLAO|nr:hypothetical protein [Aquimarina algicola]TPN82964.1 hypothetical protein FHK87_21295 [Aquimarina algicola]
MRVLLLTFCLSICIFSRAQQVPKPAVKVLFSKIKSIPQNGHYSFISKNSKKKLQGKYQIYLEKLSPSDTPILMHSNYIVEEGAFEKGLKDGFWKTSYKNKIVKKEHWNNGLISNEYSVYNTEGKLLYQIDFGAKGNGKYKDFYYNTGILKQEGSYENGKKEGEWCTYNEKGTLLKTIIYHKGILQTP